MKFPFQNLKTPNKKSQELVNTTKKYLLLHFRAWTFDWIPLQQLQAFQKIDQKAYARLTLNLGFKPGLSKESAAFWHWLERKGFRNFVLSTLTLDHQTLQRLSLET
ncbi:hypothetical protein WN943_026384 [Citrus x changshan-huyou]